MIPQNDSSKVESSDSPNLKLPDNVLTETEDVSRSGEGYDNQSTFQKGSMYDFTDPKRIGPSAWTCMHTITKCVGDQLERSRDDELPIT